ncbi:nitrilase [Rhodothalassium salexigens DSM 2132]|uniref:Nitrilase n=1 Tax=Rhodothalassium salexigens DSM 2132 TaxID=1188247 RepID=A0A4R2PH44_RHOSA|nr:nitrilase-related carbon-nitrogen hydrolase [Rhodothalassium salexigens]MBB4211748.1 nitrilase [Rhodothalassium salexigens DSM 2132]MBK1639613.1 nitrilase [Rhodothalassium salexigens DSM 2132]TCP33954.1 nitrilase [Rhodothalassium salexigens DSM 2132]
MSRPVRAAVIQMGSTGFDVDATLGRISSRVAEAAAQGAEIAVLPEALLGGYPKGLDFGARVGLRLDRGRDAFQRYHAAAVDLPGPALGRLSRIAADNRVYLVVGVVERDGGTLYCTQVHLDRRGRFLGKHRKTMPTASERLIWGFGDGSTLPVFDTEHGRVGGAICWENYMPLLRMALYGDQVQLYCASTVDDRPTWQHAMHHIAYEGRCFVLSAAQVMRRRDYPDDYDALGDNDPDALLIHGGSVIVSPFGETLAGPLYDAEGVLVAELDLDQIARGKYDLDVVGHYARPDLFQLHVNTRPQRPVARTNGGPPPALSEGDGPEYPTPHDE